MSDEWAEIEADRGPWYGAVTRTVAREFAIERDVVVRAVGRSTPDAARSTIRRLVVGRVRSWEHVIGGIFVNVGLDFAERARLVRRKAKEEPVDLWLETIREYLAGGSALKKARHITETTRRALSQELAEGVASGEGILELRDRLRRAYDDLSRERAVIIARTEVVAASNLGSRAAAQHSGVVTEKFWIATSDLRTREWHAAVDGQTRRFEEPYNVRGEALMFPGDGSLGASASNLVQCRCVEGYR